MPVTRRGTASRPDWAVVLYGEDQWWAGARQAAYPTLLTGALAALAVVVMTTVLARRFVRPIQELGRQTAAIAQGEFQPVAVPPPRRRDPRPGPLHQPHDGNARPVRAVGAAERAAADARAARRRHGPSTSQLRHRRLDGRRTAPAAVPRRRGQRLAGVAIRQLRLMESYLQRFLTLGRPSADLRERVDLEPLVRDVLGLVGPACSHAKIDLGFEPAAEPLAVLGDAEALRQVLVNLILNAVEAAGRPGGPAAKVLVELSRHGDQARAGRQGLGPRPGRGRPRPALRALRQREARGHRPGTVRRPPGRRGPSRHARLAARRRHDLLHSGTSSAFRERRPWPTCW